MLIWCLGMGFKNLFIYLFSNTKTQAHAIYRDFSAVKKKKNENFIGKFLIFLIFLLKTSIVGTC